ncbi:MAG: YebC/PmpR family DNA-binding transcriptional regulator [Dehalococcoidia bacterium]|nr:MAG: YebC/PmpR family DNA-binding transcriptional regulator [Dehalococcoidia bacterium]UCG84010.1 MAG: YebC/PmpR family DNA-binding transcriptional regulator [Dehalococcoidia bacterium]
MSGHSKWATIKRQKGAADARRGQLFTKLAKEITVAARQGDSDPQNNARLRLAVQKARDNNMPLDNIERAIKRATGSSDAAALTELTLEGYGPGGSAILLQALTDNRNRTLSEVRNVFSRNNVNLGESGCVSWIFEPKGVITVEVNNIDAEELALLAIDAGADDVKIESSVVEIQTQQHDMEAVRKTLEEQGITISSSELLQVPKNMVKLDEKSALQSLKLMEKLEELDDVQHVFTNADFPDDIVEKYQG